MAEMIPDRLPHGSSRGEKLVFEALQRLPDDYLVYYEPIIANRYPDFIIVAPDLGVLIVEVKGWYTDEIAGGDLHEVRLEPRRGEARNERHPIRQAREYQFRLLDDCRKNRAARSLLCHRDGPNEGKFLFPFGHFAVLSNMNAEHVRDHPLGDLTRLFPSDKVLTRDRLDAWQQMTGEQIRDELKTFFDPFWAVEPLDARQVAAMRLVIHPEIRVGITPVDASTGEDLAVLDLRQERNARSLGDGHRILYGVAGSGKTVLLISRAKMLADQNPKGKVLLLCYNMCLAARLEAALRDYKRNIKAVHFDGWASGCGEPRKKIGGKFEPDKPLGERLKAKLEAGKGDSGRYDAVLIDEAQDFEPVWLQCAKAALKDPDDGDLMIVGDRRQGIFGSKRVTWSGLGIKAQGRTINTHLDLDKNYRNTREILELAALFAGDDDLGGDDDQFGVVSVDPSKCLRSNGVRPFVLPAKDRRDECRRALSLVRALTRDKPAAGSSCPAGLRHDEIGIVYPYLSDADKPVMEEFVKDLETVCPVVWLRWDNGVDRRRRVADEGVKVQTIHSAKGLQYRAVIVLWAGLLPKRSADPGEESKLMYVALTRPEDYLFITCSDRSEFISRILKSELASVWPGTFW